MRSNNICNKNFGLPIHPFTLSFRTTFTVSSLFSVASSCRSPNLLPFNPVVLAPAFLGLLASCPLSSRHWSVHPTRCAFWVPFLPASSRNNCHHRLGISDDVPSLVRRCGGVDQVIQLPVLYLLGAFPGATIHRICYPFGQSSNHPLSPYHVHSNC